MSLIANVFVGLVALLHSYFLVLEMFLWDKPTGLRVFGMTPEKAALSKTLAREHARHGITVNVVCPGPTDTALFADFKQGAGNPEKLEEAFRRSIPLGRIGQPEDLAGAILFFSSADAGYVTGQVLSVSGGLTMNG